MQCYNYFAIILGHAVSTLQTLSHFNKITCEIQYSIAIIEVEHCRIAVTIELNVQLKFT